MTVCIAAICEQGKKIVVAADRMYTSPPPLNVEFESEETKVETFCNGVLILSAGGTAITSEVLEAARAELKGKSSPTVAEAAEAVRAAYQEIRLIKAEENIVIPSVGNDFFQLRKMKGMTLPQYLAPQMQVFQMLTAQMQQFNLETDLVVAGVDGQTARVAVITHPGSKYWLDKLGFGAVGSGAIHALSVLDLSGQSRTRGLFETLHAVYSAKVAAQVAPGVGEATDLAVIGEKGEKGGIRNCEKAVMDELARLRKTPLELPQKDLNPLKAAYENSKGA